LLHADAPASQVNKRVNQMGGRGSKRIGLALAAIAGLGALHSNAAVAADLTVGAFGGIWEQTLKRCAITPFQAKTGKTVEVVLGSPVQWLNQIAASPSSPPLDVIFVPSDNAFDIIDRGLVEKFTSETVPNLSKLRPEFANIGGGFGVVHNYGAMGIIYNSKTVKEPPKNWKEFVDGTVEGKWAASVPSINYPGTLSTMVWHFANLYGGGVNNIEPGLKKIKEMKGSGNVSFWADPNQVLNGLKSGEIDVAMYWDGRAWAFIDDGNSEFKYVNPEPGSVAAMTWIMKVKNSPDLAWEFVNSTLSAEVQGCFGSGTRYGVGNADATFEEKVKHQITRFNELSFPPFKEVTTQQGKWIETWNKEIGQ
jgi:putative spermidine/putrescine transport system substrate-binding protein